MRALLPLLGLLTVSLAACVDTGPPTQQQITTDIESKNWTRNQLPPLIPGRLLPSETGDRAPRFQ